MSFNPLEEKGIELEEQLRNWKDVVKCPFNKYEVDNYSRVRQIFMNGIEVEAWGFKNLFSRVCNDIDDVKLISQIRRIEDAQQTTINWLAPSDQSVLETTLGYEQVAVDLTAYLAQNEPDNYVKETYDFGLLEDFDHLYRYSQWAYIEEGVEPDKILHNKTDVIVGRPTQHHHNCNAMRVRKHYDKYKTSPKTKVNILTLVSAEQQTHNYYAEHGFNYGNKVLRGLYAEIKDVEEEHVTMYQSLIDPNETLYEKLLLHEFCEVCNYYTCLQDETDTRLKNIWEMFLNFELAHLQIAAKLFEKHEKRSPEEIIGSEIIIPSSFKSQKTYVTSILNSETDKRLADNYGYANIENLPENWAGHAVQKKQSESGSPSENTIRIISQTKGRDIVIAEDSLANKELELLERGIDKKSMAPDTVTAEELGEIIKKYNDNCK